MTCVAGGAGPFWLETSPPCCSGSRLQCARPSAYSAAKMHTLPYNIDSLGTVRDGHVCDCAAGYVQELREGCDTANSGPTRSVPAVLPFRYACAPACARGSSASAADDGGITASAGQIVVRPLNRDALRHRTASHTFNRGALHARGPEKHPSLQHSPASSCGFALVMQLLWLHGKHHDVTTTPVSRATN